MPAEINQDFITYTGDDVTPVFTVIDQNGTAVDISGVSEITWTARDEAEDTALVTKTKSGGTITFVTDGTDGKFQVAITSTDTGALSGYYLHQASIKDVLNRVTTVTVGRMQVGVAPTWTYNPAKASTNAVYQVRRLIGDVLQNDQQMQDDEIQWYVDNFSNVWTAAGNACLALAAQFARLVDTIQGELRTLYGQRSKNYLAMANTLLNQGKGRGPAFAYAGGISQSDKLMYVEDTDRVPPQFNLMIFDNLLPITPVGQQVPSARPPDYPGTP
jgi:hypothetical protein